MKTSSKILLGVGILTASAAFILFSRVLNTRKRLTHISDEGYETAHDILYPAQYNRGRKLHYGPVLPVDDEPAENY